MSNLLLDSNFYLIKTDLYINGVNSIDFMMDLLLTIIITLYSRKNVFHANKKMAKVLMLRIAVIKWDHHYYSTFEDFVLKMSEYFRSNNMLPFSVQLVRNASSRISDYVININYDFFLRYHHLNSEIKFPNLNGVIKEMLDSFCISQFFTYRLKFLNLCRLEFPITIYGTSESCFERSFPDKDVQPPLSEVPKQDVQLSLSEVPNQDVQPPLWTSAFTIPVIIDGHEPVRTPLAPGSLSIPFLAKINQVESTNVMLSQMIEYINASMLACDDKELRDVIRKIYAIYSQGSKKRERSDSSEESPSQKPRI
jgi:hypothetical protein